MIATPEVLARRLRLALEMHEDGLGLQRLALRRLFPQEIEAQISERLRSWLQDLEVRDLGPALRTGVWPRRT